MAVTAVLLPIGLVAGWASATLYDSNTFSKRVTNLLRSPVIRHEIAVELTDRLAAAGNKQAIDFRPHFELAVEGAVDTEAFQSIFGMAVASTHHDLLAGREKGIDLSRAHERHRHHPAASRQRPAGGEAGWLPREQLRRSHRTPGRAPRVAARGLGAHHLDARHVRRLAAGASAIAVVHALRSLGLDDATLSHQADAVVGASAVGAEADGVTPPTLRSDGTQQLYDRYGTERVDAAARAFTDTHPPVPSLFDLGAFSPDGARAAGYGCLVPPPR